MTPYNLVVDPDPSHASASGDGFIIQVFAYAPETVLYQQDGVTLVTPLPVPILTVKVAGALGDPDPTDLEYAREKVEEAHKQAQQLLRLQQRLANFIGKVFPVQVQDLP